MKFAVFTVGMPEFTPESAVKILKDTGYDGVEWRVVKINPDTTGQPPSYWGNNLCTVDEDKLDELVPQIRDLSAGNGLEICALATYLNSESDPARIERALLGAKAMGAGQIRVSTVNYDGSENYRSLFDRAVCQFRVIEGLARKTGVKVNLEIHMGNLTPSASAAYRLVSHFDPSHIGVIYDTGNIVFEGLEQYKLGLEVLGGYLAHVHLKNAQWTQVSEENGVRRFQPGWATMKGGFTNFDMVIDALKAVGYDGWLSFEDFSTEQTTEEKLRDNLAYIKGIVEASNI